MANIGVTAKEKSGFRDGLRSVLQEMKTKHMTDFETVSLRMIEYRRSRQESADQSVSSFF